MNSDLSGIPAASSRAGGLACHGADSWAAMFAGCARAAAARVVANGPATRSDAPMRARPCLAGVLFASSLLTNALPAQAGAADGAAPAVRAADPD
ncbi:MAG: hypothetical protein ACK539_11110, partial [Planctomycetota bacterium]